MPRGVPPPKYRGIARCQYVCVGINKSKFARNNLTGIHDINRAVFINNLFKGRSKTIYMSQSINPNTGTNTNNVNVLRPGISQTNNF
jgi:hypothetical protein